MAIMGSDRGAAPPELSVPGAAAWVAATMTANAAANPTHRCFIPEPAYKGIVFKTLV
jgi:hypothetical protein